ncbi:hypothetical protein L3X38_032010 [Prunus dulcis]|uniref:Uncharacterized protein n=1 Tax=Prunus dulcis TaxID=3755 RepID=A0AAD4VDL3_PRUDU|nr:hypothetical protein L3X38_032010 [Prunus dulcis]
MEEFRRCLERQERETRERNRRADEVNELQRQVDEQVLIAVALQEEENQGRCRGSQVGRRRNVERHRHSRGPQAAGLLHVGEEPPIFASCFLTKARRGKNGDAQHWIFIRCWAGLLPVACEFPLISSSCWKFRLLWDFLGY